MQELVYVFEFHAEQTMQNKLKGLKTLVPNRDLLKYFTENTNVNVFDDY